MKVEIYSDVVCPWCYIGERRFARALAAFPGAEGVEVVFRPFQLDPSMPQRATPLLGHLERKFGPTTAARMGQVRAAAAGEGLTFDFDRALAVNTLTAHRLLRLAEREHGPGVQRALMERLFDAYFARGGDVSDHALLASLAEQAGMDAERVRAYLASDEGERELQAELRAARELGVQAVPTFVFDGKYMVEGGQPASTFLQVLEEVERRSAADASERREAGEAAAEGDDACADGACAVTG